MTKLISVSKKAYEILIKRKGKDASFSDVIISLYNDSKGKGIEEFAGALKYKSKELKIIERKIPFVFLNCICWRLCLYR